MSLRRALARCGGALFATMMFTGVGITGAAAAAPPYTLEERALAIATPALVYVETTYTGYVRDKNTKQALSASPVVHHRICSGFAVNPDGLILSSSWCAAPPEAEIRRGALRELARSLVVEKKLTSEAVDQYVADHMGTTAFTGLADGSAPDAQLFVQQRVATPGLTEAPAVAATVLVAQDAKAGSVAVLKASTGGRPAVELNTGATLAQGDPAIVVGFGPTAGAFTAQSAKVQVLSAKATEGTTYHRVDGDAGSYSMGGMVIDMSGRVIGVISPDFTVDKPSRAFLDMSHVTAALSEAGQAPMLGTTDRIYRRGLDEYFSGKYRAAIADLDKVVGDAPDNQLAANYRRNAADRLAIEGDATDLPGWLIPAIAAAVVVIVAATVLMVIARRRSRRRAETEMLAPISLNPFAPISGVPVSGGFSFPSGEGPGYPAARAIEAGPSAAVPRPVSPGIPVPYPPVLREQETDRPEAPAQTSEEFHVENVDTATESAPATADAPAAFVWPADDDPETQPSRPVNPWSPYS